MLKSDLHNASTQLALKNTENGSYPNPSLPSDIKPSGSNAFQYTSDGTTYCLTVTSGKPGITIYSTTNGGQVTESACAGHTNGLPIADGMPIQTITNANCPATRTRAVDTRDNHTYWVQKLADGKCWMLTNLAYGGGGTNTYGDVKTLTNGTSGAATYTVASYYVVPSTTNYTTEPTSPSSTTSGTGQYGYLYNWCAALGGQTAASACANATTPLPDVNISVCPAGWRLPTGNGGEFGALNAAINSGSTNSDVGLRTGWLLQYSGGRYSGFVYQNGYGLYWSSTQGSATNAHMLNASSGSVQAGGTWDKTSGYAVRCVAS